MRTKLYNFFNYYFSFISGKTITKYKSSKNGTLTIQYVNGKLALDSKHANYSYNQMHKAFRNAFNIIFTPTFQPKNILILGMGGGSAIQIIKQEMNYLCDITAIEHDPVIIKIASDYFSINDYKNLTIVEDDAYNYSLGNLEQFDFIIVDIFKDLIIPSKFISTEFVNCIMDKLSDNGVILFNVVKEIQRIKVISYFNNSLNIAQKLRTFKKHDMIMWTKTNVA